MRRRKLREPFVFFVDECLGRYEVPDGLRAAIADGEQVVTRPKGTLDLVWIPEADANGWVCFTKRPRASQTTERARSAASDELRHVHAG